jgi:GT2 family glycosyltransferase
MLNTMKNHVVYVIILNWNGWKDTAECVESCLKLSYADSRILIVDNGSSDDSEAILRERFPDIELIQTGVNLGFAGGNNAGIRYALNHGADYVWLLNNDTVVAPDALTALVAAARQEPKAGMLGSKIYYFDEPDRLWFAGGWINYRIARTGHIGSGETDAGRYDTLRETDYITGCSLLVPRDVIESVGLMDERFFLLFEETDWNERTRRSGWKILYVPASRVRHKVSRSLESDWAGYYYYLTRNSLLFTAKHKPVFLLTAAVARVLEAGVMAARGKSRNAFWMLRGIFDFCRRRFGGLNAIGKES